MVYCSIITIGDELLIGQTIDTNSAFIAQELNKIGVWVRRRVAVGDVYDDIWHTLDEERNHSDIILITGGLGPTADDITKPLLCKYFGGKLVVNQKVLDHVRYLFEKVFRRPGPILEVNLKQAEVPDNCEVLFNKRGTAPGMWFSPPAPRDPLISHSQSTAPLNPPQGGTLKPQKMYGNYSYLTANPSIYGLLKKYVEEQRKKPTEAEKVLWQLLKGRKLSGYKFRRQHIIGPYIADFVSLNSKLIIEVDGLIHQLSQNKKTDAFRTKELNNIGFEVLRFTNNDVLEEIDNVSNKILSALNKGKSQVSVSKAPPSEGLGEAVFISLPGVPYEMKGLMTDEVIPRLQKTFKLPAIIHRTAFTFGQGESMLADSLKDLETSLPPHIRLAYLPHYGMVKLRLTSTGEDQPELEKEIQPYFEKLQLTVKDWLVANEDKGLEVVIGDILKEKNKTMGAAESCTGGYIAHLVTTVPGSSNYFKGSIVSYANEVKENILGVKKETIRSFGAVSEETVIEMVKGAIDILQVNYAVAVSGIMGPAGGTAEKPVGTVWIAAGNKNKTMTTKLNLRFDRQRNIETTAAQALNFLRKFILADS